LKVKWEFKAIISFKYCTFRNWATDAWRPNELGHDLELIQDYDENMPGAFNNGIKCMKVWTKITVPNKSLYDYSLQNCSLNQPMYFTPVVARMSLFKTQELVHAHLVVGILRRFKKRAMLLKKCQPLCACAESMNAHDDRGPRNGQCLITWTLVKIIITVGNCQ
jgi:hypothetical protein